jgi:hypothetical protein
MPKKENSWMQNYLKKQELISLSIKCYQHYSSKLTFFISYKSAILETITISKNYSLLYKLVIKAIDMVDYRPNIQPLVYIKL